MHVFLVGIPLPLGGGNVEAGHTALMLRRAGVDVTCLYFSDCRCNREPVRLDSGNPWVARFLEADIPFVAASPGRLGEVPGLGGSILLSFCNSHTIHNWLELASIGCRLIWSPCMCQPMLHECETFRVCPPATVHFQSYFQRDELRPFYADWGCRRFRVIRGAFEPFAFSPRPHHPGEPFVVGRLARPCRTKWSPNLWAILSEARKTVPNLRALCQGWSAELEHHCGVPPAWARCLPPNHMSAEAFLGECHALVCPNWGIRENWPRVGLEAMSAGVPILADNEGGWREMIADGDSGLLCNSPRNYATGIELLATRERERRTLIEGGRKRLKDICDEFRTASAWLGLFAAMGDRIHYPT